jgi:CubicO group peptidase (beta-lactamase class C family)
MRMRRRAFLTQTGQSILAALATLEVRQAGRRQASSAQRSAPVAAVIADLEKQIPAWMGRANVPGLTIVLIENAAVAWRRSYGIRDAASRAAVDDETMFEAASMSKPVFAYVVMKLCDTGVLDLDTPLTKYARERFLEGDPLLDRITARHVLSHTSGFQNWRSEKAPLAIHFPPGERYLYSGEGYNYLQTVVTTLLKQPFERYMHDRLFAPFGMTSSQYVWDDTAERRMAHPHDPDGKPTVRKRSTAADVARYGSAGALLTTPTDYAAFLINVIDPKPADAFRLNRESVREMLRPHVKVDGPFPASWALGWQVFHNPARDFIYHGGDNAGFHCSAVASVDGKCGFVAMTNGENGTAVLKSVLTANRMQAFLGG